ncbi:MAG: UPF0147 family protein [Candidatus Kariarchaeaceae archaeon]
MSAKEQVKVAIEILNHISEDQSVPRNIRRTAIKSVETLNDTSMDILVRAINAIELLEDSTSDPNCPYHARTMLWQAITRLELPTDADEDDDEDDEYEDDDEEDDDD